MKEDRYFYVPDALDTVQLPPEESVHALRVLRLRAGDEIYLMDGKGCFYRAEITYTDKKSCHYEIQETIDNTKGWHGWLHLAIAPTKMIDRMEWLVEKATEVGFDEITFLKTHNSERKEIRIDRIEKIVVAAMKQSRKAWKPVVNSMTAFHDFIASHIEGRKYIAHCHEEIAREDLYNSLREDASNQSVTVMVGSEGDFTMEEVEKAMCSGFKSVSLGEARLRTETAGLYSVFVSQLFLRR